MIQLKNIFAGYEKKEVLHGVSMKFERGKITALIGPNGCGKSTLLKTIVRMNPHSAGEIHVDGQEIGTMSPAILARHVSYLPQNKKAPDIPVLKMVLHGRFAYLSYPRRYRKEDYEMARKALSWAGMETKAEEIVSRLSGGMQQKVYIAMALAQDTDTILMDEPTTYLDISQQLKLMDMARELAKAGKAVVMVLHDLSQALRVADEVVLMDEGNVVISGRPNEVYESGALQKVFHVEIERIQTKTGWHYICESAE